MRKILATLVAAICFFTLSVSPAAATWDFKLCNTGGHVFRGEQSWVRHDSLNTTVTGQTLGYNSAGPSGLEYRWRVMAYGSIIWDTGYVANYPGNRVTVPGDYGVYGSYGNVIIIHNMGRANDGYATCQVTFYP